jgi:hypothetical protein
MELRDRFLGPIARETGGEPEGPAAVDFGDLIRKLVLFDRIIVQSHNLKEPTPITQKFGYDGAKALLESGRIRLVNDMGWVADIGQAPRPNRPVLPIGSYSINAARLTPPREFLSRQLHRIDDIPGLTAKQAHMEGRLSRGSGDRPWLRVGVGVRGRGRFPGRHELECRLGRPGRGQAHMRGLVTSRPLFVAGLAI